MSDPQDAPSPLAVPQAEGFEVRRVPSAKADKAYVCPDCDNPIPARQGHVVVWPEGRADLRDHWHLHCWRIEARRRA